MGKLMAKKDFTGGLDSLIPAEKKQIGKADKKNQTGGRIASESFEYNAHPEPEPEPETRATFIIKIPLLDKVKAYAYWERLSIKDVMNMALDEFFKNKKDIKPIPKKK